MKKNIRNLKNYKLILIIYLFKIYEKQKKKILIIEQFYM